MNKITHTLTVVIVGMLLAGCSIGTDSATENDTVQRQSEPSIETEETEPATITSAPTAPSEDTRTPDEVFIENVAGTLSVTPSNASLIAAGQEACTQLTNGATIDTVSVVLGEGESAVHDNRNIASAAQIAYCPIVD